MKSIVWKVRPGFELEKDGRLYCGKSCRGQSRVVRPDRKKETRTKAQERHDRCWA